jgi:hypothetical protein
MSLVRKHSPSLLQSEDHRLLRVFTHWLLENPIISGHLYHLTLLTGSGYLLALVIGFRRRLSISRNMAAVHTVDKNSKVLHYAGNRMESFSNV